MKKIKYQVNFQLIILIFGMLLSLQSLRAGWYNDPTFGFSINVPNSWTKISNIDNERVMYNFVNPDKSITIQIKALKVPSYTTAESLARNFEQNFIRTGKAYVLNNTEINGLHGKSGRYQVLLSGKYYDVTAFFAVNNGHGFIIRAMTIAGQIDNRLWEIDNIIGTFTYSSHNVAKTYVINPQTAQRKTYGLSRFRFINAVLTNAFVPNGTVSAKEIFQPNETIKIVFWFDGGPGQNQLLLKCIDENHNKLISSKKYTFDNNAYSGVFNLSLENGSAVEGRYAVDIYYHGIRLKRLPYSIVNPLANYHKIPGYKRYIIQTGESFNFQTGEISKSDSPPKGSILVFRNCNVLPELAGNFVITSATDFNDRYFRYSFSGNNRYYRRSVPLNRVCTFKQADGSLVSFMVTGQNYDEKNCINSLIITVDNPNYNSSYVEKFPTLHLHLLNNF